MHRFTIVLIGMLLSLSSAAQQGTFVAQLCERSGETCEALAVEIVRLELVEEIDQRRSGSISPSILCRDGERCCPESSENQCERYEAALIAEAQLIAKAAANDDCPFHAELCDVMETTCERDEIYLPWSGCTARPGIEIPPSPLPPSCPDGTEWNGKVCLPVPCYTRFAGIRVPCPVFEDQLNERAWMSFTSTGTLRESNRRFLSLTDQTRVREAAIGEIRAELQAALDILDEMARED